MPGMFDTPASDPLAAPRAGAPAAPAARRTGRPTPTGEDALRTVMEVLEVRPVADPTTDDDVFVAGSLPKPGGRVFGGQVLAQSVLAASRTVAPDRLPHAVHGFFLRPGDVTKPITFAVERLRDGRSFSARRTHALQDGEPILAISTSFQVEQAGVDHTDAPPPSVPHPDRVPSALETLGDVDHPVAQFWTQASLFDIRHVEDSIYLRPGPMASGRQMVWMRARTQLPDDEVLHRALLAYASDQVMLEPVLRRHELVWTSPGLSVASLDHAMWWHRPVPGDEWLLFVQSSPSAQGGRALTEAKVYLPDGTLVASMAQEGMFRLRD